MIKKLLKNRKVKVSTVALLAVLLLGVVLTPLLKINEVKANPNDLLFSTFFSSQFSGYAEFWEPAFDLEGNIYIVGMGNLDSNYYQNLPGSPIVNKYNADDARNHILVKMSADGQTIYWISLYGGSSGEKESDGIVIPESGPHAGKVYVSGSTFSNDLPTTSGALSTRAAGPVSNNNQDEAFVARFNPDDGQLEVMTYLGGANGTESTRGGLTSDSTGNIIAVGGTFSPDFPQRTDANGNHQSINPAKFVNQYNGGVGEGFVVKMNPDLSDVIKVRFIGSSDDTSYGEVVVGADTDSFDNIHLGAIVRGGKDLPVTDGSVYSNGVGNPNTDRGDIYYAKLDESLNLVTGRLINTSGEDGVEHGVKVDSEDNAILMSGVSSGNININLPPQSHDRTHNGGHDGLLLKFDQNGTIIAGTFVGGSGTESILGPGIDPDNNIWVAGYTNSPEWLVSGDRDIFVRKYSSDGSQLLYSESFGGSRWDRARFIGVDTRNSYNPVITGMTQSNNFPLLNPLDSSHNNGYELLVFSLDHCKIDTNTPGCTQPVNTPTPTTIPTNTGVPTPTDTDCKPIGPGNNSTPNDYAAWVYFFDPLGAQVAGGRSEGDFNCDGVAGPNDYSIWAYYFSPF